MTMARFFAQNHDVLDGSASSQRQGTAREALGGGLILMAEASQITTARMGELLTIAERLGVGRVALIGDKRHLGAVEAGILCQGTGCRNRHGTVA